MTDQTGRPDDETRPDGTPQPDQPHGQDESTPESVLTGFSWDDPSGAAPRRPEDDAPAWTTGGDQPSTDDAPRSYDAPPSYGSTPDAPAQYPPAAPYPPAGDPYGQAPSPQQGQPYGQPASGQAPTPSGTQSGGYGSSAAYTSTPQPYAYGPPPLSPEAEKARSGAILWTILNGVAIFLCGNLLAIGVSARPSPSARRARTSRPRNLTKWSWILFAIGFALWLLLIVFVVAFGFLGAFGTASSMNEF